MIEPVHRFRALRSTLWISVVIPRWEVGTSAMDDGFEMKTSALRGNAFLVRGEASKASFREECGNRAKKLLMNN